MSSVVPSSNIVMAKAPSGQSQCGGGTKNPVVGDLTNNLPALAANMGMGATCKHAANTVSTAGAVSASVNVPFASAAGQASFQNINNQMSDSGCGSLSLSSSNIINAVHNMNCQLSSTSTSQTTSATNQVSISIETVALTSDQVAAKLAAIKSNQEGLEAAYPFGALAITAAQDVAAAVLNTYSRNITIGNSTFLQKGTTSVKVVSALTTDQKTTMAAQATIVAHAAATNHIKQALGTNALTPNTKSMIDSHVNTQQSAISKNISTVVNTIANSATSSQAITIKAAGNIDISGSTFSQDSMVQMAVSMVTTGAIASGLTASTNLISSAMGTSSTSVSGKGLDALASALGKANADAIKAGAAPPMGAIVYIVIGVIVLGMIFGAFKAFNSKSGQALIAKQGGGGKMKLPFGARFGGYNPRLNYY